MPVTLRKPRPSLLPAHRRWIPGGDIIPPGLTITAGPTKSKISRVAGQDSTDVTWQSSEAFQSYMIRVVPAADSLYTAGTLLEQDQNPVSGGTATTGYTTTITDDEMVAALASEGDNLIKVFVRDLSGNWSL